MIFFYLQLIPLPMRVGLQIQNFILEYLLGLLLRYFCNVLVVVLGVYSLVPNLFIAFFHG